LCDDHVKSASYIYQQLNLAVAGSSASLLLQASKYWSKPLSFC
jgi:hypothetical protein